MSPVVLPPAQAQAFERAICERLGIDPAIVSRVDAHYPDGEVTVYAHISPEELVEMFNRALGRGA